MAISHILRAPPTALGMDQSLLDLVEAMDRAEGLSGCWDTMTRFLETQGVTLPTYIYLRPSRPDDAPLILSRMPDWWADFYLETQAAARDPFFKTCQSLNARSIGMSFLNENQHMLTTGEARFIHEAADTGLISGLAQPVQTINPMHYGGWNFGSELGRGEFLAEMQSTGARLQMAAFLSHSYFQKELASQPIAPQLGEPRQRCLTPREKECLTWLAKGLRAGQIADKLTLAKVTVDLHLASARRKLGAITREQALVLAVIPGEISL
jgi:DNA-binding CsgD family transcriptional regulator